MTWVRLDDGYYRNSKSRAIGKDGRALHLASICWSAANLTDGIVRRSDLPLLLAEAEVRRAIVDVLVTHGAWKPHPDGWEINGYLDYNRPAAAVKAERSEAAERMRKVRENKAKRSAEQGANVQANNERSSVNNDTTRHDTTPRSTSHYNDDSRGTGTESSSSVETVLDEVVGRLALAAGKADHPGWKRATRTNQRTENADAIAQALAAGTPAAVIVQRILDRQPAHQPPPVDHAAANARSMIAGLVLTGTDPADAWQQALDSHPRHADAIAAELHARTGWTPPDTGTATVPPIRGAATQ